MENKVRRIASLALEVAVYAVATGLILAGGLWLITAILPDGILG